VPPGDVRRGALVLAQTAPHLPHQTVHVAVVDPGVGTARRGIAIETGRGALVGPDNGLLLPAAEALGGVRRAVELTNQALFHRPVSSTFHGRDVFTPVAAHLTRGADLVAAGPELSASALVRLPDPGLRRGAGWVEAEVLTVDRFGNVQLAAGPADLADLAAVDSRVNVGRVDVLGGLTATRGDTFGSVTAGDLVVYVDSANHVAVAVNGGSAAEQLNVVPGDTIRLTPAR
jgi:hypothetical protein